MSLKAKIEAVIYASEEPVTLQQLIGLLGLEAQSELDADDARQGELALEATETRVVMQEVEAGDPDALNAETLGTEDFASVAPQHAEDIAAEEPESEGSSQASADEGAGSRQAEQASAPDDTSEDGSPGEVSTTAKVQAGGPELSPAETRARERRLREYMRSVLDVLIAEYRDHDRGLEIREIAGGFRFATKPEYHDAVRGFVRSLKPPLKVSLQALETLAVVAYKQPVTAPEVSEIRGVDSAGVLGSLIGRKLVATAGRKQVIGRPILYKTTKEFLLRFGLKDLNELPSIEEFERLAADLNDAVQEEIPMAETLDQMKPGGEVGDAARAVEPNRDVHASQADGFPDGPADPDSDDEMLLKPQDGPGEFTGDETAAPVDNASIDGRQAGVPPTYDPSIDEMADSPAADAAIQRDQEEGR